MNTSPEPRSASGQAYLSYLKGRHHKSDAGPHVGVSSSVTFRYRMFIAGGLLHAVTNFLGTELLDALLVLDVLQTQSHDDAHTVLVILGIGLNGIAITA